MGFKDAHDPRTFTPFLKLNDDGTVAALVEVADTALATHNPNHDGGVYVDATALTRGPVDVFALTLNPVDIATAKAQLPDDRLHLGTALRTAVADALPAALTDAVFGVTHADDLR